MDNEDRKILTEFLGECWFAKPSNHFEACCCGDCLDYRQCNRTFDTWEDFGALINKIASQDKWEDFLDSCADSTMGYFKNVVVSEDMYYGFRFVGALIDKDYFPILVLEAIKEGVLT